MLVIGLISAIICLLMAELLFKEDYDIAGVIFTVLTFIGLIFLCTGLFLSIKEPKIDTGRKQYVVRLNNDMSINEFYDKYKIIEHTKYTDIYTVEELQND